MHADGSTESGPLIDEIVREGARRLLAAALEAKVNAYLAELTKAGRRLVVAATTTSSAPSPRRLGRAVTAPRVNDRAENVLWSSVQAEVRRLRLLLVSEHVPD